MRLSRLLYILCEVAFDDVFLSYFVVLLVDENELLFFVPLQVMRCEFLLEAV